MENDFDIAQVGQATVCQRVTGVLPLSFQWKKLEKASSLLKKKNPIVAHVPIAGYGSQVSYEDFYGQAPA